MTFTFLDQSHLLKIRVVWIVFLLEQSSFLANVRQLCQVPLNQSILFSFIMRLKYFRFFFFFLCNAFYFHFPEPTLSTQYGNVQTQSMRGAF